MEILLSLLEIGDYPNFSNKGAIKHETVFDYYMCVGLSIDIVSQNLDSEKLTIEILEEQKEYFSSNYELVRNFMVKEYVKDPIRIEKLAICYINNIVSRLNKLSSYSTLINDIPKSKSESYDFYLYLIPLSIIMHLKVFCPLYEYDFKFMNDNDYDLKINEKAHGNKIDQRKSSKAPTNLDKVKALKILAPDLWLKLIKCQDTETQKKVVHLITGTNLEDSYKYSFGSRSREANKREIEGLNEIKKILEIE